MTLDAALATLPAQDTASAAPGSASREHLIFELRGSLYAVEAAWVREVHLLPEISLLAQGAPFVAGVINLRGRVVPILDLALRLGLGARPCRVDDCLIVLQEGLENSGGETCLALICDGVRSVQPIASAQIEPVPLQSLGSQAPFLAGVARVRDHVVMLLSAKSLLRPTADQVQAPQVLAAPRFSMEHLAPDERAVLRERARLLMAAAEEEDSGEAAPVALVALHGERYGLALHSVREFCQLRQASPVPCCPPHILGQMNLRGDIVTLLDIQPLLQMPARQPNSSSVASVVVAEHAGAPVGIVVDEVLDVLYLSHARLAEGASSQAAGSRFFEGAVLHEGRLVCLLDLPRVLSEGGLSVDETV